MGQLMALPKPQRKLGAVILSLNANVGKGDAVLAGIAASGAPQSYLLIDADLGESAIHAAELLKPLSDDTAEMVVGVFPKAGRSRGFGLLKRVASQILLDATGQKFVEPYLVKERLKAL